MVFVYLHTNKNLSMIVMHLLTTQRQQDNASGSYCTQDEMVIAGTVIL